MTVTPEFGFPLPSDQSRIVKFPSHLRTLSTTLEEKLPGAVRGEVRSQLPPAVTSITDQIRAVAATAAHDADAAEALAADAVARVQALEAAAGFGPSTPEDGQTASFILQPDTQSRAAVDGRVAAESPAAANRALRLSATASALPAPTRWPSLGVWQLPWSKLDAAMSKRGDVTVYEPWIVEVPAEVPGRLGRYYCYWSTDHDNDEGGVYMAYADHPGGPWTVYVPSASEGRVFVDRTSGRQTETPCVVWDPDTARFVMLYQQDLDGATQDQMTRVATSPDGLTWTVQTGKGLIWPAGLPGNGHTGYAKAYRLGRRWIAYSLAGGGTHSRTAIWHSINGLDWTLDRRLFTAHVDRAADSELRATLSPVCFMWRGQLWGTGVVKSPSAGRDTPATQYTIVGRIAPDGRGFTGDVHRSDHIGSCVIAHDGELWTVAAGWNRANPAEKSGGLRFWKLKEDYQ